MYPSKDDPVYGPFIKTYMDSFLELNHSGKTQLICIKGRSYNTYNKVRKYLWFYLQILYYLIFKSYDIVYVQTITTTILPIKLISYFKSLNIIYNVHGADVITMKKITERLRQIAVPLLYKSKLIIVPSEYFKEIVLKMLPGLSDCQVFVSPSGGVDLELFKPSRENSRDYLTLGYVSRIDYGKGWDTYICAMSLLKKEGYSVRGIIAGRGSDQTAMIKMIKDKDVEDLIEYVGPIPHEELPLLFNKFDVFVFPSRRNESLGLVGVEALACGVPIIGSNYAALPGYIIDGINGYLFESGNVVDLYTKVKKIILLPYEKKLLMSENARRIASTYDTKVVMKDLYEKLNLII